MTNAAQCRSSSSGLWRRFWLLHRWSFRWPLPTESSIGLRTRPMRPPWPQPTLCPVLCPGTRARQPKKSRVSMGLSCAAARSTVWSRSFLRGRSISALRLSPSLAQGRPRGAEATKVSNWGLERTSGLGRWALGVCMVWLMGGAAQLSEQH
jgi:hypothetical protein